MYVGYQIPPTASIGLRGLSSRERSVGAIGVLTGAVLAGGVAFASTRDKRLRRRVNFTMAALGVGALALSLSGATTN